MQLWHLKSIEEFKSWWGSYDQEIEISTFFKLGYFQSWKLTCQIKMHFGMPLTKVEIGKNVLKRILSIWLHKKPNNIENHDWIPPSV